MNQTLPTFGAGLRYEFRMQVRRPSVWIVPALTLLLFLLIGGSLLRDLFDPNERPGGVRTAMAEDEREPECGSKSPA